MVRRHGPAAQARLRGIPAFSILDLITELTRQGAPLNPRSGA